MLVGKYFIEEKVNEIAILFAVCRKWSIWLLQVNI